MYVAGIVEREEWSEDKRLSEKGKGNRVKGEKKRGRRPNGMALTRMTPFILCL